MAQRTIFDEISKISRVFRQPVPFPGHCMEGLHFPWKAIQLGCVHITWLKGDRSGKFKSTSLLKQNYTGLTKMSWMRKPRPRWWRRLKQLFNPRLRKLLWKQEMERLNGLSSALNLTIMKNKFWILGRPHTRQSLWPTYQLNDTIPRCWGLPLLVYSWNLDL